MQSKIASVLSSYFGGIYYLWQTKYDFQVNYAWNAHKPRSEDRPHSMEVVLPKKNYTIAHFQTNNKDHKRFPISLLCEVRLLQSSFIYM